MSGHNKWSKIKNKKAVSDAKKSKIYSKLVRLIQTESRIAKGDITAPNLRSAVEKARSENMPGDNIERAIKKGSGETGSAMESVTYEAYGPGGVAVIIEALTDNRNKAAQEIKFILSKHGLGLASIGSATWAFQKNGKEWTPQTTVDISEDDSQKLESLIEELEDNDEVQEIYTNAA